MDDDRHSQEAPVMLSEQQQRILRKHLARQTLSLDDAAVLLGVHVDDLAAQFQGRRTARAPEDDPYSEPRHEYRPERGARRSADHRHRQHIEDDQDEPGHDGLRAPQRHSHAAASRGSAALWVGGLFAVAVVLGGLALLSGIPQSLLFSPRGVTAHKDADPAAAPAEPSVGGPIADAVPADSTVAEAPPAPAVDPMAANVEPGAVADPAADPALGDPASVAPPADAMPAPETPVPAAPEEVAPAVAVAESGAPAELPPEPPASAAPAEPAAGPSSTLYATRGVAVRDAPTVTGSTVMAQIKRGEAVSGTITAGSDGKSPWMHIESGPGAGGYVSVANMADTPRPAIVQAIGQQRTLTQAAALHARPDTGSATLDSLSPGISVLAAAEVEGGWIEINRRAGGVGYVRVEAFQ